MTVERAAMTVDSEDTEVMVRPPCVDHECLGVLVMRTMDRTIVLEWHLDADNGFTFFDQIERWWKK